MTATKPATVAAFIEERLAEDEATALAAHEQWPGPWTYDRHRAEVWHSGADFGGYDRPFVCNADGHLADEHIATHDPARVLAQVKAMRAIVAEHSPAERWSFPGMADLDACPKCQGPEPYPCPTLRALAAIWAGEEGWDEGWAL